MRNINARDEGKKKKDLIYILITSLTMYLKKRAEKRGVRNRILRHVDIYPGPLYPYVLLVRQIKRRRCVVHLC